MLTEFARCSYTAIKCGVPMPEVPIVVVAFLQESCEITNEHTSAVMYMLGNLYSNGLGVPPNEELAFKILSRAAALGDGDAMYCVSGAATQRLRIAATRGSSQACYELATMDKFDESYMLRTLEITPFDISARKMLATHYEKSGRATEALVHHFMMARQGHMESAERLAHLYCEMSADNKMYLIPSMYWASMTDSPSSMKTRSRIALVVGYEDKAFEYMKGAVSASPAGIDATYELSRFYEMGVGTPMDKDAAEKLLESAAEGGHASAQFDLAMKQFRTDKSVALDLIRKAAKTHAVAMHFLSRYDSDRSLLEKAGELVPAALYDLAIRHVCMAERENTEANYDAAARLLERALAMPEPAFACAELDREQGAALLAKLKRRLQVCYNLGAACMDTILRLAQFNHAPVLTDIADMKLE